MSASELFELLRMAKAAGASDLHLTSGERPVVRVDGELRPLAVDASLADEWLAAVLDDRAQAAFAAAGQVDVAFAVDGVGRVRASVYKTRAGLAMALRLLPERVPSPAEIRLPAKVVELAEAEAGLLLVTGATGSGKSTTLAALVHHLNGRFARHIVTLEDPVEYLHRNVRSVVHQREVGRDARSFAEGLRASLRQDPDVILVGELRDSETMAVALTAAETGHLVLSTLHTNGAAGAVDRIVHAFPAHQQPLVQLQLASVLVGVVAQELLPRRSGGRVAAFEVLVATPAVRNLIREGKSFQIPSAIQTGAASGMQTMEAAVRALRSEGLVE